MLIVDCDCLIVVDGVSALSLGALVGCFRIPGFGFCLGFGLSLCILCWFSLIGGCLGFVGYYPVTSWVV